MMEKRSMTTVPVTIIVQCILEFVADRVRSLRRGFEEGRVLRRGILIRKKDSRRGFNKEGF